MSLRCHDTSFHHLPLPLPKLKKGLGILLIKVLQSAITYFLYVPKSVTCWFTLGKIFPIPVLLAVRQKG